MKSSLSKSQVQEKIKNFFEKEYFSKEEMKKIKRIAMKYTIKLEAYRKKFCKRCLSQLKGKIRISRAHKSVICEFCNFRNKFKIN